MFQNNGIFSYSAAKARKLARRKIKKQRRQQPVIECSIFSNEEKGTLHSEMALTCLWGCVAHCSAPRGKPRIQGVPQLPPDGVQSGHHNHTASCPSQTTCACKETWGFHTFLATFVPKYNPFESESVAIVIQHAILMGLTVLSSVACLALEYVSILSHTRHNFKKMCVLIFSTTFIWNI
jgi:hypothetical protein